MMSECAKKIDFKGKIVPHLEILLQCSLWLTMNGHAAARLMRETITEAYRSWDESISEASCGILLYKILFRRFFNGFQKHTRPHVRVKGDNIDKSPVKSNRLFPATTTNTARKSFLSGESDEDIEYLRAVADLPAVIRSAMILSYLEGFAPREISDLAGVQPHAIEALLNRGRGFIQEELFTYLIGNSIFNPTARVVRRKKAAQR